MKVDVTSVNIIVKYFILYLASAWLTSYSIGLLQYLMM
jgi:hypothetical protein